MHKKRTICNCAVPAPHSCLDRVVIWTLYTYFSIPPSRVGVSVRLCLSVCVRVCVNVWHKVFCEKANPGRRHSLLQLQQLQQRHRLYSHTPTLTLLTCCTADTFVWFAPWRTPARWSATHRRVRVCDWSVYCRKLSVSFWRMFAVRCDRLTAQWPWRRLRRSTRSWQMFQGRPHYTHVLAVHPLRVSPAGRRSRIYCLCVRINNKTPYSTKTLFDLISLLS